MITVNSSASGPVARLQRT